jgi:Galactose oxidase, central domain
VVSSVIPAPNTSTLSLTASAELYQPTTLSPSFLVSIAVTPASEALSLAPQTTRKFIATGTFSSGPPQQLASVTWSSTDVTGTNVAQISNDPSNSGVVVGLSLGTATINACAGTICGSSTITVVPTLNYTQLTPSKSPSPRCCSSIAFDPVSNSTLLFGGVLCCYSAAGDTWHLQGGQWSLLSLSNAPSPREGAAMAYDAATNTLVLFGGTTALSGAQCCDLNDTWIWNGATSTWTQVFPSMSPPARRFDGQGMAYDPNTGTVVLFGGTTTYPGTGTKFGDTWTWNGLTQTWTQQSPATSPTPRFGHGMTNDRAGNIVLFGGTDNTPANLSDTWVWDGTTWQQQSPATAPAARGLLAMVYDPDLHKVVLFGGASSIYYNDTWTWDGLAWTHLTPATNPPDRYAFGMDYDNAAHAVVLFGGFSSGPALNDTWELAPAP